MADANAAAASAHGRSTPVRLPLIVMAIVAFTPLVAAVIVYFFFPRDVRTNYGRLLEVAPVADISGTHLDGTPFRISELKGKWVLLHAGPGECAQPCRQELYATRQARTIQGRDQERVQRVWLVTDEAVPPARVLQDHPGLVVARVRADALRGLSAGSEAIYLIDPLGNLVLQYPEDPDIKALSKDLGRLLKASSIG